MVYPSSVKTPQETSAAVPPFLGEQPTFAEKERAARDYANGKPLRNRKEEQAYRVGVLTTLQLVWVILAFPYFKQNDEWWLAVVYVAAFFLLNESRKTAQFWWERYVEEDMT